MRIKKKIYRIVGEGLSAEVHDYYVEIDHVLGHNEFNTESEALEVLFRSCKSLDFVFNK